MTFRERFEDEFGQGCCGLGQTVADLPWSAIEKLAVPYQVFLARHGRQPELHDLALIAAVAGAVQAETPEKPEPVRGKRG